MQQQQTPYYQWRNWRGGRGVAAPWPVISKFLGPLSPHC